MQINEVKNFMVKYNFKQLILWIQMPSIRLATTGSGEEMIIKNKLDELL